MRRSIRSLLLAFSLVAGAAQADDEPKPAPAASLAELDQRLAEVFRTEKVPGASVAIVEGDAVVFTKAYGMADVARQGFARFEAMLALEGVRVSSITIQKILHENGLGTKSDRWLALEQANAETAIELTAEQAAFIEKLNPCFRERHVESSAPGELLSADTFFVGSLKGIGRVYLHAVVDTFGSYAFGFLHVSKQPEAAVAVLHNDVLPFYRNLDLPVRAVLTNNGREFCGTERHPYEL